MYEIPVKTWSIHSSNGGKHSALFWVTELQAHRLKNIHIFETPHPWTTRQQHAHISDMWSVKLLFKECTCWSWEEDEIILCINSFTPYIQDEMCLLWFSTLTLYKTLSCTVIYKVWALTATWFSVKGSLWTLRLTITVQILSGVSVTEVRGGVRTVFCPLWFPANVLILALIFF